MIPKILHYIWLGGKKPKVVEHCIKSFYKYLPDYKIIEWNESNIDTSNYHTLLKTLYKQFYDNKQYAYCSDIARLYLLKEYGGIYVDTDVEFIKHIPDTFLETPFTSKMAHNGVIAVGLIWGTEPNDRLVNKFIDDYVQRFIINDLNPNKFIFNQVVNRHFNHIKGFIYEQDVTQYIDGYHLYESKYFAPISVSHKTNINNICKDTISIHYYSNLWNNKMPHNLNSYLEYKDILDKFRE